jgi:polynucleotide 5'-kinase involved in rRNA processing
LAKWTLTTLLDANETMQYLAYFGYPITGAENQTGAIRVTREKHLDVQKKQTNRTVFLCHVIGQQGAGKSTFCQGLLKRNLAVSVRLSYITTEITVLELFQVSFNFFLSFQYSNLQQISFYKDLLPFRIYFTKNLYKSLLKCNATRNGYLMA